MIIATWKQEITNLWKFKWRDWESNPGPLAPIHSATSWCYICTCALDWRGVLFIHVNGFFFNPCHALPLKRLESWLYRNFWLFCQLQGLVNQNLKSILNLSWESPTVNLNCKVCSSFMVRKYTLRLRSTKIEEEGAAVYSLHISRICQPLK